MHLITLYFISENGDPLKKRFQCDKCDANYSMKITLKKHMKIHGNNNYE